MKRITQFSLLIFSVVFLISCSGDDEGAEPKGKYESGVFVINEGNFGEADGSISFIHDDESVDEAIFSIENDDRPLGDVVQSMHIANDLGYILVNNSNVVEVVNPYTMESQQTIEAALPRYMTSSGEKGYFTEWVSFSDPGRVSVIDLETGDVTNQIEVGYGAEGIIIRDGKLYVSNNFSNSVSVIDIETETVSSTIEVGASPAEMVLDQSGRIWVICQGGYNDDWSPANNGKLLRISSSDEIDYTEELGMNVSGKIARDPNGLLLYFINGSTVYSLDLGAPDAGFETFVTDESSVGFYGIGVNTDGLVYVADAKGFQTNGSVYVYDEDGGLENEFSAGRGTSGFCFQ